MGLDWIIDIWNKYIHTKLPWAELHIYSYSLHKALLGETLPEVYDDIIEKVKQSLTHNIKINLPKIDTIKIGNIYTINTTKVVLFVFDIALK